MSINFRTVIGGDVPLQMDESVCSAGGTVCSRKKELQKLAEFSGVESILSPEKVIEAASKKLGVDTEEAIWKSASIRKLVGNKFADNVLALRFKITGPANNTNLLTNLDIDKTLAQWSRLSTEAPAAESATTLFPGRHFYHVPYQMIDFAKVNSELATLDLMKIVRAGYNCMGVILNTDVSTGPGRHWFCIFADLSHKGTEDDPWQLEYFNSSGNPPLLEVDTWLEDTTHALLRDNDKHCIIVRSAPRRLQNSHTECGIWSLLYIRSRLEGHPPDWFYTVQANDSDMIAARKKLFRV